jgi:hypothetical protein
MPRKNQKINLMKKEAGHLKTTLKVHLKIFAPVDQNWPRMGHNDNIAND